MNVQRNAFLEVTDLHSHERMLVPVDKIMGVLRQRDGTVFIEMGTDPDGTSSGVEIAEDFETIKEKLFL